MCDKYFRILYHAKKIKEYDILSRILSHLL